MRPTSRPSCTPPCIEPATANVPGLVPSALQKVPSMTDEAEAKTGKPPLAGLRVLDLSSVVMGPYCTLILGQLGAEVIKLESLEGDIIRNLGPARQAGMTGTFHYLNAGKKSIAIDLSKPEGRDICLRLAATVDIFVHSIRPSAIAKLGLAYDKLAEINPGLIYCNLLGFGRGGRYFGKPAYDDTIQAVSGLAMLEAEMHGEPTYVTSVFADKLTGMAAVYAILAAVVSRSNGSGGQEIDVPMFETMVQCLLAEHATGSVFEPPLSDPVYSRTTNKYRRPFRTADGYLSVIVYNQKQFEAFCRIVGRDDLMTDPRFATFSARTHNAALYYQKLGEILAERSNAEWDQLLTRAEVPCMIVNRTADLYRDPHLGDVDFFAQIADGAGNRLKLPHFPVSFHGTPAVKPTEAPQLGRDTESILSGIGCSPADIGRLLEAGVVMCAARSEPAA